jgi:hypothetical protein
MNFQTVSSGSMMVRSDVPSQQIPDSTRVVARILSAFPELRRLPDAVLEQYADTYLDEADHRMEEQLRAEGVLAGCRADWHAPQDEDGVLDHPLTSDDLGAF